MRENNKKNMNELISATNHHQTNIVEYFISSVIHFDKSIHPMALYENYLICIFMNINENLKNEGKTIELKNSGVPTKILISQRQLNLQHFTCFQILSLDKAHLPDGQKCKLSHFHIHKN